MTAPSMGAGLKTGIKISANEVVERFAQAVEAARVFFGLSNEWRILIEPSDGKGGSAALNIDHAYLKATVSVNVEYFMFYPEDIWKDAGHEVAHLVTAELNQLWSLMPDAWKLDGNTECDLLRAAFEQTTVRLERLFVRCVPDPYAKGES